MIFLNTLLNSFIKILTFFSSLKTGIITLSSGILNLSYYEINSKSRKIIINPNIYVFFDYNIDSFLELGINLDDKLFSYVQIFKYYDDFSLKQFKSDLLINCDEQISCIKRTNAQLGAYGSYF